jgi:hypothetical protein
MKTSAEATPKLPSNFVTLMKNKSVPLKTLHEDGKLVFSDQVLRMISGEQGVSASPEQINVVSSTDLAGADFSLEEFIETSTEDATSNLNGKVRDGYKFSVKNFKNSAVKDYNIILGKRVSGGKERDARVFVLFNNTKVPQLVSALRKIEQDQGGEQAMETEETTQQAAKVDWHRLKAFHYYKEPTDRDTLEREIRAAEREIRNWNKDDVNDLRKSIRNLKSKIEDFNKLDYYASLDPEWIIRLSNLRGVHIPVFDLPRGYPVWACDRKGSCLCGEDYDTVEKLTTIMNKVKDSVSGREDDEYEMNLDDNRKEIKQKELQQVDLGIVSAINDLRDRIDRIAADIYEGYGEEVVDEPEVNVEPTEEPEDDRRRPQKTQRERLEERRERRERLRVKTPRNMYWGKILDEVDYLSEKLASLTEEFDYLTEEVE